MTKQKLSPPIALNGLLHTMSVIIHMIFFAVAVSFLLLSPRSLFAQTFLICHYYRWAAGYRSEMKALTIYRFSFFLVIRSMR